MDFKLRVFFCFILLDNKATWNSLLNSRFVFIESFNTARKTLLGRLTEERKRLIHLIKYEEDSFLRQFFNSLMFDTKSFFNMQ